MNKEEHPMKELTRMKMRETMVAVALCALAGGGGVRRHRDAHRAAG